ncbi:MAG: hypothetical protein CVU56_05170 [Deltaproteobacteria bacterium HGW-Deltaproteobacteria-14]|jgi:phytoene dehydrogenase-like protein|nr:MAG: hypothetical protein CVU56_05170 [Deltaproteobacteria bacterium HGW-Deltaproteobacteria-14]
MTQAWYHIVVIGTDLAGLMYAALAARLGYRVAVIGQGARPNAYRTGGYVFLREPERFYGFASSPAVSRVFGELSLGIEMKNRPRAIHPTLQVVLPHHRIDVAGHRRQWERELDRELPGAIGRFDAFEQWAAEATRATDPAIAAEVAYPPSGLRGRSAYRKIVAGVEGLVEPGDDALAPWFDGPEQRAVIAGALGHLTGLSGDLAPIAVARLWTHLRAGLYRIPGGLDGLKEIFLRKLREQSSDFRPDAAVSELVVRRGKVVAVRLADRHEAIGCQLVVGNIEPHRFLSLVPRDQRHDAFHASLAGLVPAGWRLTVNLGVQQRVVPAGMGPEVVVVGDPEARLAGANSLWIARPGHGSAGGDGRPGPGVLQVTTTLTARGAAPTLGAAERLVEGTLAQLRRVIPWLDDHIEALDVPALTTDPASGRPALDPLELAPIMGRPLSHTLGATAVAPSSAYKNVLICGDLLYQGLGFEGTCLAALQTLALSRQLVRMKTALSSERKLLG